MSLLLRLGTTGRWKLYSHPYSLPLIGNLFFFSGDAPVVQLAVTRESKGEGHSLYIDFLERVDADMEHAFRDVISSSHEDHEIVVVGYPGLGDAFNYKEARFRRSILIEGQNISDWLAAVVIVTWRTGDRGPELLLQVNTPKNSTREMGKASHVSGYINECDQRPPSENQGVEARHDRFTIGVGAAANAAARELLEIGLARPAPVFVGTVPFIYFDKENLFFFLFRQEIPRRQSFDDSVLMFNWTLDELVRVRRHHVLSNAIKLLDAQIRGEQLKRAARLIECNLRAHGDFELATNVASLGTADKPETNLSKCLKKAMEETVVFKYSGGIAVYVEGIAGLQYRAFFSHLLPNYAEIGVPGAAKMLEDIRNDERRATAVKDLQALYQNEEFMTSVPIEV